MRSRVGVVVAAVLAASACSAVTGPTSVPADPAPPAVRSLLDSLTAAADSVAGQQSALAAAVDPADGLAGCAAATGTIRFEPVWAAVRPDPDWRPAAGRPPAGEVFAVPTVLRVVQDARIVGTDIATVHVGVRDGVARLAPFCVR